MRKIILIALLFICCSTRLTFAQTGQTYWWNNTVFYELFVRSFYDSNANGIGDFNGITQKLDYLDSLGVKAIWVMPINPSPSYHGYDVTNYYDVNPQYGTKHDFTNFLNAAHARGMKVIIDWVMNHTSSQHPWFQKSAANDTAYRNYYRWSDTLPAYPPNNTGPFGSTVWHKKNNDYYYGLFDSSLPDINYNDTRVKDSMFNATTYWLDSMHVDGFRLDAAIYIFETADTLVNASQTLSFWHDFHTLYKSKNPNAMAVGEAWVNGLVPVQYVTNDRLDFCFEFNQAASILNAVNHASMASLKTEISSVYNTYPYLQYGSFLTNHDQNRVMDQLNSSINKAKGAAAIYLTIPGIPFVYYGEEIGMSGGGGDQNKRSPMQWTGAAEGGFSTAFPWETVNANYKTVNVAVEQADQGSILNWYKKLIAVRNAQPALRTGTYKEVTSGDNILSFLRSDSTKTLFVVINPTGTNHQGQSFDVTGANFSSPYVQLLNLLDSSYSYGTMQGNTIYGLTVPAYSAAIYELSAGTGVQNISANSSFTIYPNPAADELTVNVSSVPASAVNVKVTDVTGKVLKALTVSNSPSFTIDVHNLPGGFYMLQLSANGFTNTQKFVKE